MSTKSKGELEFAELDDYYRAHQTTLETIAKSISELRRRSGVAATAGEKAEIENRIVRLEADLRLHEDKLTAFEAGREAIEPPTDEQLENLRRLLARVDELTAQGLILEEFLGLAKDSIQTFKAIHPDGQ